MNRTLNLLIAEDDQTDLKLILRAFTMGKIKSNIFAVKDGIEVLDFLHHRDGHSNTGEFSSPDIVLMDVMMPKLNGIETLKRIRQDPSIRHIPVVMFTTSMNDQDICVSYQAGAVSYLPKPSTYDEYTKFIDVFNEYWARYALLPSSCSRG